MLFDVDSFEFWADISSVRFIEYVISLRLLLIFLISELFIEQGWFIFISVSVLLYVCLIIVK